MVATPTGGHRASLPRVVGDVRGTVRTIWGSKGGHTQEKNGGSEWPAWP